MSETTRIEWTDATWNPIYGCTRVSDGCRNCYAERFAARFPERFRGVSRMTLSGPRWTGQVALRPDALEEPLRWRKPRRVFVCSMSDLFHEDVPDEFIASVFGVMAAAGWHTYQVLTKRPERMVRWFEWVSKAKLRGELPERESASWARRNCVRAAWWAMHPTGGDQILDEQGGPWPLPNVWIGVSAENQQAADERIPLLLETPAAVRFVSCEPLLGPVDLSRWLFCRGCPGCGTNDCWAPALDWVIVGGESGPWARPMHPAWVRSLRDQCQAAGVPFLFKQWGTWLPEDQDQETGEHPGQGRAREAADGTPGAWRRAGKGKAGRLLDGRVWDEFPEVPPP